MAGPFPVIANVPHLGGVYPTAATGLPIPTADPNVRANTEASEANTRMLNEPPRHPQQRP